MEMTMDRVYFSMIQHNLNQFRQMAFISGPRQVGKTTCSKAIAAKALSSHYINWDNSTHRRLIIQGASHLANTLQLEKVSAVKPMIVFDEIHKYRQWKLFLKGFFDLYEEKCQIIVTGSAKLDIYRRGGDSLMGRYFLYRMHPLSVAELLTTAWRDTEIIPPQALPSNAFNHLYEFGGFPEPYTKANPSFSMNWQRLRKQQLLQEDIRALSQIQELAELEFLMDILIEEASGQLNIAKIANHLNVAQTTIHRWIMTLNASYYCYTIKPWFKNIKRSIRKTLKVYLWDWSVITDPGKRLENFVSAHLYKAVQFWTDSGFGEYDLFYLRDKEKREVDFLVTKNKKPWFLVEVKNSDKNNISPSLRYYADELKVQHAFQVVKNLDYRDVDCFNYKSPIIVSLQTFLSQLV